MKNVSKNDLQESYNPLDWTGTPQELGYFNDIYPWIDQLPNKKIYLALWRSNADLELPENFDYYIIIYHNEPVDLVWLEEQQKRTDGRFYVLMPRKNYDITLPGITFFRYYAWDYDCAKTLRWFPGIEPRKIKYKYSAICNRASQSKVWITTKLLETAKEQSLIVLNDWIEEKNVHNWIPTGNSTLDNLTNIFRDKWEGIKLTDEYENELNHQRINSNPWQPAYINTALHFNNGGFHYSLMQNPNGTYFTHPGPEVCEKTIKCLISATPFINCNQFDTYKTLEEFGMQFDYGFDLTWENDPGNITRFKKIIDLIDDLNENFSAEQIDAQTKESCLHNQNHILSGGLHRACQTVRNETIELLIEELQNED